MADKKETLMSNISKNVAAIKASKFGRKLPSKENGSVDEERTMQSLAYDQMIMGTLASLVWGKVNIKKDDQVKTLLGNNKNIFGLVQDIKDTLTSKGSLYKQIVNNAEANNTALKTINDNLDKIITNSAEVLSKILDDDISKLISSNSENVNAINKEIDESFELLLRNLKLFVNKYFIPITGDITSSVKELTENKKSLTDSVTEILIDIKAADTIKELLQSFNKLESYPFFDTKNIDDVNKLLESLQKISEDNIFLVVTIKDLENLKEQINSIKLDIYDPELLTKLENIIKDLQETHLEIIDVANVQSIIDELNNKQYELINLDKLNNIINRLKDKDEKIQIFNLDPINDIIKKLEKIENKPINIFDVTNVNDLLAELKQKIDLFNIQDISQLLNDLIELKNKPIIIFSEDNIFDVYELINHLKNIKQEDKIDLFDITTINDFINKLESDKIEIFDIKHIEDVQKLVENINGKKIEIIDENTLDNLTKLFSSIKLDDNSDAVISGFNGIYSLLEKLSGEDFKIKTDVANKNLVELQKVISDKDISPLKTIITNIGEITKDITISDSIGNLSKAIDNIISVISIDPQKINTKGLRLLVKVTDPNKKGYVGALINNLQTISAQKNINTKAINALEDFFNAIIVVADINARKRRRIKNNINYIKKHIIGSIPEIAQELDRIAKKNKKDASTAIDNLSELFKAIVSIADLSLNHKLRLKLNLLFIKDFIVNDIGDLLKSIQSTAQNNVNETTDAIESLMKVIDMTLKFGDISFLKIMNISLKTSAITSIIENELTDLLTELKDIQNIETAHNNAVQIGNILNEISSIYEETPSLKDSLNEVFSLTLTIDTVSLLRDLVKELGKIQVNTNNTLLLKSFIDILKELNNIYQETPSVKSSLLEVVRLMMLSNVITSIDKLINNVNDLPDVDVDLDKLDNLIKVISKLGKINKIKFVLNISEKTLDTIAKLSSPLKKFIEDLAELKDEDIKKSKEVIKTFFTVVIGGAAILLAAGLIMKSINILDVMLFAATLSGFLWLMSKAFVSISKSLKDSLDGVKDAIRLIAAGGAILLFGAFIYNTLDHKALFGFTFTLTTFLFGIGLIFKLFSDGFKNSLEDVQNALILISGCAAIMIFGSLIYKVIDHKSLFGFVVTLSSFMLLMSGALWLISKSVKDNIETAKQALIIVSMAAAILIVGALAHTLYKFEDALLFTLELSIFMGAMYMLFRLYGKKALRGMYDGAKRALIVVSMAAAVLIVGSLAHTQYKFIDALAFIGELAIFMGTMYMLFHLYGKKALRGMYKNAKKALIIVGMAAAIIIAGALAHKLYKWEDAMAFVVELGTFLIAISVLLWGIGKLFKHAVKNARGLMTLIVFSAAIMIAGQLLYDYLDTAKIFGFVLVLGGFIIALAAIFWVAGKLMKRAIPGILLTLVVTALAGFVLLLAGKIVADHPEILAGAWEFGKGLVIYVAVMGLVCGLLGLFKSQLIFGVIAMAIIMLVTLLAIGVMDMMYQISKQPSYYDTIIEGLESMGWVFGSFIAVIALLGLAVGSGVGAAIFFGGVAALLVLEGVIALAAKVMEMIVDAMKKLQSVDLTPEGFDKMKTIIGGFGELVMELIDKFPSNPLKIAKLVVITGVVKQMSFAVGAMAKAIKEFADLKIPTEFDSSGNPTNWVTIANKDFSTAQENIGKTLTCIIDAILSVAKDDRYKDLFDEGLFTDSPAMNAAKVAKKMGEAVGSIAKGIKEMADLKIVAKYGADGKPIEWISLGQEEFKIAQENIGNVLTCINNALLDVAKDYPELFDDGWFTDSPAMNAAKVAKKMGEAVGSIAKGIKEIADLKIVSKYDSNGNPTEWIALGQKDFDRVAVNLAVLLTCVNNALLDVAKNYPELFDDGWFTDSPAMNAAKVAQKMGDAIGSIAIGIKDWADLKIATKWDKDGKPIEYKGLADNEFIKAGKSIEKVLVCIGKALVRTVKGNTELFSSNGDDSPALQASKAMMYMGATLAMTAKTIAAYSIGKVPVYDKDGNLLPEDKWISMNLKDIAAGENGQTYKAIYTVLTCLGKALLSIVKDPNNKEIFDTGFFGGDSPAMQAAKSINQIGETLKNVIDVITDLSNIKTEDLTDKLNTVQTNIGNSLNAILNIFKLFAGKNDNVESESVNGGFKGFINTMSKTFGGDGDVFSTNGSIVEYINNHIDDIEDAADAIDDMKDSVSKLINALKAISSEYEKNQKELEVFSTGVNSKLYINLDDSLKVLTSLIGTLVNDKTLDLFDDIEDEEEDIIDGLTSITNVCKYLLNDIAKLENIYNKLGNPSLNIYGFVNKFTPSIQKLISNLINKKMLDLFEDLEDDYKDIIKGIKNVSDICNTFLTQLNTLQSLYETVSQFNIEDLIPMITQFNNCINALKTIGNNSEDDMNGGLQSVFTALDAVSMSKSIEEYSLALDMLIAINEHAQEAGEEGYNILRDGILKVYGATQQIEDNGIFKQHVGELEDYIEAINSIKLDNIVKLKNLVDSMNALSQRLGNLDNLTDAIGNKLSSVLYELVVQLRLAEATIKNAHELQEKRKKLMDESISKIENIMGQHMIVEISQVTEGDETSSPGNINNNPVDNAPSGTDNTPETSTPKLDNPEGTSTANGTTTHTTKKQQAESGQSLQEFKNWMVTTYLHQIGAEVNKRMRDS